MRFRLSQEGSEWYWQRKNAINEINTLANKYMILLNVSVRHNGTKDEFTYEILDEIVTGNGRKIKSYGFSQDSIIYCYGIDGWLAIENYIERMC